MSFQIAVDVGGTFTDGVLLEEHSRRIWVAKSLTTNEDPGEAIAAVVDQLLAQQSQASQVRRVVHGTTLITNTLLERTGSRAALVVTCGTRDVLDIRREMRFDIYDLSIRFPAPLVAREDRFEVGLRMGPDGSSWQAVGASELESGPAGGVLSGVNCGEVRGLHRILAFDMGGTTAKSCIAVDGKPDVTHLFEFAREQRFKKGSGLPARAPSIDLIEIGAGGGSMASINALGLLQVGPQSAGSAPGPACYGLGGRTATVTDADLLLGYLDPRSFLGGRMSLRVDLAQEAVTVVGRGIGLDALATAWGIHDIVNENMAAAARTHIAEKGYDARQFAMVATGGAGPVHALDVARRLRIKHILCPVASGVGSCLGFLAAPARADGAWSRVERLAEIDIGDARRRIDALRADIERQLHSAGVQADSIKWQASAEIRYVGQGNCVDVEFDPLQVNRDTLQAGFEDSYCAAFGRLVPGGVAEIVTWRMAGASASRTIAYELAQGRDQQLPDITERAIYLPDLRAMQVVPVHTRQGLTAGVPLRAPLVVTEPESTLVCPYPALLTVHPEGTIEIALDEVAARAPSTPSRSRSSGPVS